MKKTIIMLGFLVFLFSILLAGYSFANKDLKIYKAGYNDISFSEICGCPRRPPEGEDDRDRKKPPPPPADE